MLTLETYNINKMVLKNFGLIILLFLTACSFFPHILYKIDVQQGNVVTEEIVEKLKPGMTKSQVLFIMGSPLIVDTFRDNRWDYVYVMRERGDLIEQKRLTIFFNDDKLINIENYLSFSKDSTKPKPTQNNSKSAEANPDEVKTE